MAEKVTKSDAEWRKDLTSEQFEVARKKGTAEVAKAYLEFLYTEEAQEVIAKHYYRPTNKEVKERTAERFPKIELFSVTPLIDNSWDAIEKRFFAKDGVFDRIYTGGTSK